MSPWTPSSRTAVLLLVIDAGNQTISVMLQIQDRVGAVGGTAAVRDGQLRVEMPCAL